MIIKHNELYQLQATVTPCGDEYSVTLSQLWPKALRPHWRKVFQVQLTAEELKEFGQYLSEGGDQNA